MSHESHSDPSRWELRHSDRIVYDKATGEVVHVHQVLWRPDREAPSTSVIDTDARRVAAKVAQRDEHTLEVLPVELEALERNTTYVVDLRTKKLINKAS